MKTTLVLDDAVAERLRVRAKERGVSMSSIVEDALIRLLASEEERTSPPPRLPSYHLGLPLVDVADRDALYDVMDPL